MKGAKSQPLKSFGCPIHQDENIIRVRKDHSAHKMLYCVECIMDAEKHLSTIRSSLINLKAFIEHIYEQMDKYPAMQIDKEAPENLKVELDQQSELFKRLEDHMNQQKESVAKNIDQMKNDIVTAFDNLKEEITADIDHQQLTLKRNFKDYEDRLRKHFKSDQPYQFDKDGLFDDINNCMNTAELELKIKSLLLEVSQARDLADCNKDYSESTLIDFLAENKGFLDDSLNSQLPVSYGSEERLFSQKYQVLMSQFEQYLSFLKRYMNPIISFTPGRSLDSKIITLEEKEKLRQWVTKQKPFSMELVYRSSRDGFNWDSIYENFNFTMHAILLIKTEKNEIIGCYRDQPRNPALNQLFEKYFAFSLTTDKRIDHRAPAQPENDILKLRNQVKQSFFTNSIFLVNNSDSSKGSYHLLNCTHTSIEQLAQLVKAKEEKEPHLDYFKAVEIEIFSCTFPGMPKFDLEAIFNRQEIVEAEDSGLLNDSIITPGSSPKKL